MPRSVDPARIPDELERARDLIAEGELEEAKSLLSGILFAGPKGDDEVETFYLRGELYLALGEPRQAALAYGAAAGKAPGDSEILRGKGEALFALWEFERARDELEQALRADKHNPRAHRLLAVVLDRLGKRKLAELHFARAAKLEPEEYPLPVRVERATFDDWVRAAIAALPKDVHDRLGSFDFMADDYPELFMLADRPEDADPETLGLFFGEAIPERYESSGLRFVPNHIHLFQRNLEQAVATREELEEEIRTTVFHEVGHYLGYDEDGLDEIGLA